MANWFNVNREELETFGRTGNPHRAADARTPNVGRQPNNGLSDAGVAPRHLWALCQATGSREMNCKSDVLIRIRRGGVKLSFYDCCYFVRRIWFGFDEIFIGVLDGCELELDSKHVAFLLRCWLALLVALSRASLLSALLEFIPLSDFDEILHLR